MKGNDARWARARRSVWAVGALAVVLAALIAASGSGAATNAGKADEAAAPFTPAPPLQPLDPQNWKWQDDLTWNDYHALPGPDYSDASIQPTVKKWRVALVLADFDDKPYALTQPAGSTIFGNPQAFAANIPRADVGTYLRDFLNTPNVTNHFQTMNRYWMEDSYGKYGVQLDVYGPYRLPGKSWRYFAQDFAPASGTGSGCIITVPAEPCNLNFRTDTLNAWRAATGNPTMPTGLYDNSFYVSPGQDESGSWQEFGNMLWTQTTVPDTFGPKVVQPTTTLPNWMTTRYVPWTSWASGITIWPNASTSGGIPNSIEGESSGMSVYAHELSHNLNLPDNYNNPYDTIPQRSATGMWDMMSRGSFNGAGGPHQRWLIPPTTGSALGSQHALRNKLFLGFLTNANQVRLNRNGLATTGLVVTKVQAREAPPTAGELSGVTITLDGTAPVDKAPSCGTRTVANPNLLCADPTFNGETVEVAQQIGSDSFDPGHGVMIAKTKTGNSNCGRFSCFVWYFDAHPENMNRVDFIDGQGVAQMVTYADERQLDDASFNVGTASGTQSEYEDTPNRLHYYVLDKETDANGILEYNVGIRNIDGAGPQTRDVDVTAAPAQNIANSGSFATCTFGVNNTGTDAAVSSTAHPQGDVSAWTNQDIYRLSVSSSVAGWTAQLYNEFTHSKFGEGSSVPVYVTRTNGSADGTTITLTATSVGNTAKTDTATCAVALDKPAVSFTLNPATPSGSNGWYNGPVSVSWTVTNADTTTDCGDFAFTGEGTLSRTCSATNDGGTTAVTATVKRDTVGPVTSEGVSPAAPNGSNGWYVTNPTVSLSATDATSGVASSRYYIGENGAWTPYNGPFLFCSAANPCGKHWFHGDSTDFAGNTGATSSVTLSVDLANPTSSASIAPLAQNGWYASPTVTLTGDDGANGSGIDHISYKIDGEASWHTYAGPLTGFSTGNHFVQFQATDVAGRVESSVNLVAFKADSAKPTVTITAPVNGKVYTWGKKDKAKFKCTDKDSGIASCVGTVADGENFSHSPVGPHTFTVTATDKAGNVTVVTNTYQVQYTWNGFFTPVTNTETSKLNLVHAGDTIKLGFGLDGDHGLGIFAAGFPTSVEVACPSWTPHLVSAAGAGTPPGLSYGNASGHYSYAWGTSADWVGHCREFQIQIGDGSTALHKATFMFFA